MNEPSHAAPDGTQRLDHYGAGRQPFDEIVDAHWGPEFCAGNALKYVRRDSDAKGTGRERDLKHARWYYARLAEMATGRFAAHYDIDHAAAVAVRLDTMLTEAERVALAGW